ncbi:MAG: helix-turn-helix transcriptional regulator [Proteobacteria bacterium]|nr:helix-turn-helix transcriptional regulator [Pseudomonadota bacterium]
MNDAARIVAALKKLLRSRGFTYAQLAARLGLSEASVKRLFSRGTFTLARLEALCAVLDVDFLELARLARGAGEAPREMTRAQEAALAADPQLLAAFYLVFNGWTYAEIVDRYAVTAAQCTAWMVRLDKLGVLDFLPGNRIRMRVPRHTQLIADGPIRRKYGAQAVASFLAPRFADVGGYFAFEFSDLSRASRELLQRKLERLVAEFHELAELDAGLRASARETVGFAAGLRPWSMEQALPLAPRRRARSGT